MDRAQMPEKLDSFKKAPLPVSGGGIFLHPFCLRCACKADIKAV
ncbi:MAG: hypothetical protein OGM67_09620 [Oscillospiraceae bacterium]|nr:MAG: hypothetical protein OGM67_09620 [Oscillospiraceae bacterium]